MKILVCDVCDFEQEKLNEIKKNCEDELILANEPLSLSLLDQQDSIDGISILGYSYVNESILDKMSEKQIRYLSTRTIGYDHIDVTYAKSKGIHVYHAYYDPNNVADFTIMLMLILLRKAKVSICRSLVNDFSLDGLQGRELRSLTVGVIGTGKIGSTVIKNLSGFGCKIIAYDPFEKEEVKQYASYVPLDELYQKSDIITLHIPLTKENYHMIQAKTIDKMKKGVILINTARGQLIHTKDLIDALEQEKIAGAGIDTLEEENGVMHEHIGVRIIDNRDLLYLKQFPNVVYTQHYAFYTKEACDSMIVCGIRSIQDGYHQIKTICEI